MSSGSGQVGLITVCATSALAPLRPPSLDAKRRIALRRAFATRSIDCVALAGASPQLQRRCVVDVHASAHVIEREAIALRRDLQSLRHHAGEASAPDRNWFFRAIDCGALQPICNPQGASIPTAALTKSC